MLTISARLLFLFIVFTMSMTYLSYEFFSLAKSYIDEGHGLHPFLSIPIGIFCLVNIFGAAALFFDELDIDAAMDRASLNHPQLSRSDVL